MVNQKKIVKVIKHLLMRMRLWNIIKIIRNSKSHFDDYNEDLGSTFYSQFVRKGDLIFDIGANIGNRVNTFCNLGCKVIAVEPQSKCCEVLSKRFINSNVIIENIGLSNEEGELEYFEADENVLTTFSKNYIEKVKTSRHETTVWKKSKKVKMNTLENLVIKYGLPKFCKIDVEGFEYQVLEGMKHNLPYISFEYNVPELEVELAKCIKLLGENKKYIFNYSQGESMKLAMNSWLDEKAFLDIIKSQEFLRTNWGDLYCQCIDFQATVK